MDRFSKTACQPLGHQCGQRIAGLVHWHAGECADAELLNDARVRAVTGDMAAALGRVAGATATGLIDWPTDIQAMRTRGLGLLPAPDCDTIIRDYVRENPNALKLDISA